METVRVDTDVLIIGGGTAGCYAAITLGRCSPGFSPRVLVAERAGIKRSGCLAAGVNAINAYISKGHVPHDYTEYAMRDADGIAREDLLDSIAERFNAVTEDLERMGLTILKDENGEYVTRGWRNLKINGENIKPILAQAVRKQKNVTVLEHLNITDLLVADESDGPETQRIQEADAAEPSARRSSREAGTSCAAEPSAQSDGREAGTSYAAEPSAQSGGRETGTSYAAEPSSQSDGREASASCVSDNAENLAGRRVCGAVGYYVQKEPFTACVIRAKAVLVATGGAAGLYRPNNPGGSKHRMWYSPFNTGAGYAMGLRAGAEMTTLEMRFIALRCKDTIAPTGTIAQGAHARQVNGLGEVYETKYGLTTSQRVYGTVMENREGRGPCYLQTKGISSEEEDQLYRAYLNMAPTQTLRWLEKGKGPADEDVEIAGTEPYVVGGHTASGYWIGTDRSTTITGLYAAGDVAGLAPQKYVTGALAEGEIAAESMVKYLEENSQKKETVSGRERTMVRTGQAASTGEQSRTGAAYGSVNAKERTREAETGGTLAGQEDSSADSVLARQVQDVLAEYQHFLKNEDPLFTAWQIEEAMQKVMDEYAGGIGADYRYSELSLEIAGEKIRSLEELIGLLGAKDARELLDISQVQERLLVCRALIEHLKARRETRWHCFAENTDYPQKDPALELFINSKMEDGQIRIVYRDIRDGHVIRQEES